MSHATLLSSPLKLRQLRQIPRLGPLLALQCADRPRRNYVAAANSHPAKIAVLGGGVSGLASAYYLAKAFPKSRITLFEKQKELGGWIKSKRVEVEGGDVLFETGPRSLRPGMWTWCTAELVEELGLISSVLYTPKESPAAKNRYIYYPDRLNQLPSSLDQITVSALAGLSTSGILGGIWSLFWEPLTPGRPAQLKDESIGSFISRRFDKRIANNLASAVFHGIYAGDIWQLSAKTLLSTAWKLEGFLGSVLKGYMGAQMDTRVENTVIPWNPYDVKVMQMIKNEIVLQEEFRAELSISSTYTFKGGLQQLTKELEVTLRENDRVEIRTDCPAQIADEPVAQDGPVRLLTGATPSTPEPFDLVISTLPQTSLTPYVTVMVVNLYYTSPTVLSQTGFGYLIPQSIPFEQNPERALGVIFDSEAVQGQDSAPGTKLTVMLGGHWWDGWQGYPDESEGVEMAKSVVRRHLGIEDTPETYLVTLSKDCIPQFTVGYEQRLKEFADEMVAKYRGRVRFVGNQVNGVGVNDCVRAAWMLGREVQGQGWREKSCGLERVANGDNWLLATAEGVEARPSFR
ncbi:Protoporphyrinogen oxidase [Amniculicola lignicola CBS 123094]|uniref:Protoporphyrinogen oxidase n=1 Tax=Amniculicola lignicola CBS 123094 TaxID=1392246 RepID=A0A6A5WIH7_9PLEO|nr:Protoporphyrinogen oxidase [Amniculicola lignicola CBS 123094]